MGEKTERKQPLNGYDTENMLHSQLNVAHRSFNVMRPKNRFWERGNNEPKISQGREKGNKK